VGWQKRAQNIDSKLTEQCLQLTCRYHCKFNGGDKGCSCGRCPPPLCSKSALTHTPPPTYPLHSALSNHRSRQCKQPTMLSMTLKERGGMCCLLAGENPPCLPTDRCQLCGRLMRQYSTVALPSLLLSADHQFCALT